MNSPTLTLYTTLQTAFDHFNEKLFSGRLPPWLTIKRSLGIPASAAESLHS